MRFDAVVTITDLLPPAPPMELGGGHLQGVPEPGSTALLFGGLLTVLGLRRRH